MLYRLDSRWRDGSTHVVLDPLISSERRELNHWVCPGERQAFARGAARGGRHGRAVLSLVGDLREQRSMFDRMLGEIHDAAGTAYQRPRTIYGDMSRLVVARLARTPLDELFQFDNELLVAAPETAARCKRPRVTECAGSTRHERRLRAMLLANQPHQPTRR